MMSRIAIVLAVASLGLAAVPDQAEAQGLAHPSSSYYRSGGARVARTLRGPQVRGFAQRRVGGYSYYREDTINTYGNVRSTFGGNNVYRDVLADRQTRFGPFDSGFFFESGIAPRGGYSPYHN